MADRMRKELKYVIGIEQYLRMRRKLEALMTPDVHGVNGEYMVRSQYFDSLTDADLKDNLDGVKEKRKIRVRVYSPDAAGAKLEYKCKTGSDGVKYSIPLSKEEVLLLEQHSYDFLMKRPEELAGQLYTKMMQQVYRPKVLIEYDRTAYLYPVSDVRITFDKNLRAAVNPYGICENQPFYIPLMEPDKGILEVKYNDFFPYALKPILSELEDVAQAYSKYSISRLNFI